MKTLTRWLTDGQCGCMSDTEAQKNSKKRRVKAIKQQQKLEKAEEQLMQSAKMWQQFNKKVEDTILFLE